MEEFKNENVTESCDAEEVVIEQRPSTKYGRTAYQQQLQEELAAQEKQIQADIAEEPYRESKSAYQQYGAYTLYEEEKVEAKTVYAYVLMVVVVIGQIVNFMASMMMSRAYEMGESLEAVFDAMMLIAQEPALLILSVISELLLWITVLFVVLDIIQLRKAGKKIGAAIAFAFFLRPAYFIWRAHLLGQKKLGAVIYAIVVYVFILVQYYLLLSAAMEMVMRTMY